MVSHSLVSSDVEAPPLQGHSPEGNSEPTPPTPHPQSHGAAHIQARCGPAPSLSHEFSDGDGWQTRRTWHQTCHST